MAKAYCYCPKCKKILTQVLSSFECLSIWNKAEGYYVPGNECRTMTRCPVCGTLAKEREIKIHRELKVETEEEDVTPPHSKKKLLKRKRFRKVENEGGQFELPVPA